MASGISIRASLALLVIATALPFVALISYNAYTQAQLEAEQAGADALRAARASATKVEETLERARLLLSVLARRPAVRSLEPANCAPIFAAFSELYPEYTNLVTVRREGERVCSATQPPPGASPRVDPRFFLDETLRTRAFTVGRLLRGVLSSRWVLAVAQPILDDSGEVSGAISVPLDVARLQLIQNSYELPPQAIALIVDAAGTIIASSATPEKLIGQNLAGTSWFKLLPRGRAAIVRADDGDGVERIYGSVPIAGNNWHAAVGIPVDFVYRPVRARARLNALFSLAALLLAGGLGYFIARRTARPVEEIAAAAREATSALSRRVFALPQAALVPREVQALAKDFGVMLKSRADAELELRDSEAGLHRAQSLAQLAHVITGPQGAFESWSETLPRLIGLSPDAMPKSTREWLELLHPEDREPFRAASIGASSGGSQALLEYRLRRPGGEWIHIRQVMEPMPARDAEQARWFSTLQNITPQKRAADAIRSAELNYRSIFENAVEGIFRVDANGRVVAANPALARILGYASHEDMLDGISNVAHQVYVDPQARKLFREQMQEKGVVTGFETQWRRRDGSIVWVSLSGRDVRDAVSGIAYLLGTAEDITERKRSEAQLRESGARLKRLNRVYAVLSGINSLIVRVRERQELFRESCRLVVDAGGFALSWIGVVDRDAMRLRPEAWQGGAKEYLDLMPLGLRQEGPAFGLAGQAIAARRAIVVADMATDPRVLLKEEARRLGFHSLVVLPLIVAGEPVAVLALYAAEIGFFDEDEMKLLLELAGDISFALEHIDKTDKLDYLAYYDSLTGLANRALLMDRLAQAAATAGREQRKFALVITDIERFKTINDTLGRQAGDALLKQMAGRLIELAGDANRVARISADYFAVLIPEVPDEGKVARIIEEGNARVQGQAFMAGGTELRVALRSGIAMFPNDGTEADVLFRNAEAALKKAKAQGERYLFYTQKMTERIAEKLSLENKLRQAIEKEEFVLHYQPKVDLGTRAIVGLEALIRWQSPELGLVAPLRFIPLLEETGMILQVGAWALKRAMLDHRRWSELKLKPPRVAVNVSAIQLRQRDFVSVVEQVVAGGLAPTGLDLEITESLIMEDIQGNIDKLNAIRALGINIAIDDFGTGYSSLAYLAKLPVSTLKIDRSFIVDFENPDATSLVSTIISLARSLRLRVVAEGVETEKQAKFLWLLKCDEAQGYLFSKPVPADILVQQLKAD